MNLKTLQVLTTGALTAQRKLYEMGSTDHIGAWIDVAGLVLEEAKKRNTILSSELVDVLTKLDDVNDNAFKYAKELHHKVKTVVIKTVFGE